MVKLSNVDLICVDGRMDESSLALSAKALVYSAKHIKFNKVIFLSPRNNLKGDFEHIEIAPINNMDSFSRFMIKEFPRYFDAEYCLTVQWDGFIVKSELWDNEFLNYDWIGAPWPVEWPNRVSRVGNGGFSLRSRKLVKRASKLDFEASPSKIEDNLICLEQRKLLEDEGFKFAPPEIAAKFSWEHPIPERVFGNSFGFHGSHPYSYLNYHYLIN